MMLSRSRPLVLGAVLLAASALTAACRRAPKTGEGPYAPIVARAVPAIERATGLKFKQPPKLEQRSKAQVRQFVLAQITDARAQRQLTGIEAAYKLFGVIPDTMSLQKLLVDLLEEQVVGFYDPKTKVLYVVEGAPKDIVEMTVTHELIHALQDQYISLDSLQKIEDNNDRQGAAQAVFEGQAVYDQLTASLGDNQLAFNLPGGWERVRTMIRDNQAGMPIYASAPMIIQETLLFPYLSGAEFIRNYKQQRKGGVPYAEMPASTEQVMHPAAFFGTRDAPTPVTFASIPGITRVYDNTLGEFETRILLFEYLGDQAEATRGATGWDGDRYLVFDTPAGRGIAWATVWDSPVDATDFAKLLERGVNKRATTRPTRNMRITSGEIGGRPVVLYIDTPANAPAEMITLHSITF